MSTPSSTPAKDDIARFAYAIWEAEGRPEGCDHEHWLRAKRLIEEGRAEIEFLEAAMPTEPGDHAPRAVQPGFENASPRMVPNMKTDPVPELREEPGGRLAKQLAETPGVSGQVETPGPRNPAPTPPTNAEGYVAIPSVDDAAGRAVADDPQPPSAPSRAQTQRRAKAQPNPAAV